MDSQQAALLRDMANSMITMNMAIVNAQTYLKNNPQSSELLKDTAAVFRANYNQLLTNVANTLILLEDEAEEVREYDDLADLFKGKPIE
jgi:hypothetical protein